MKRFVFGFLLTYSCAAQVITYEEDDKLRGTIAPERQWWDVNYYHLNVTLNSEKKFISGKSTIRYRVLKRGKVLQIDLREPLLINKVMQGKKELPVERMGTSTHFVKLKRKQKIGAFNEISIYFSGHPIEVKDPQWDAGVLWETDANGKPFIMTSCHFKGPSAWWPCKDHPYDKADSMRVSATVPKDLMAISNGRLEKVEKKGISTTVQWFASNPINSYDVFLNIGDYIRFDDTHQSENGNLNLSYWLLKDNVKNMKEKYRPVPKMLEALEYWLGPYPRFDDGLKLVDSPELNRKHQDWKEIHNDDAEVYGIINEMHPYTYPQSDSIIFHTLASQWFPKRLTRKYARNQWVYESFPTYAKSLYLEFCFGKELALSNLISLRKQAKNQIPFSYPYRNEDRVFSSDVYYKTPNVLHTLRQWIDDDQEWRRILKQIVDDFHNQSTFADRVEEFISKKTGKNLSAFIFQYIQFPNAPLFDYSYDGKQLKFRYRHADANFVMPLRIFVDGRPQWIFPKERYEWKTIALKGKELVFDKNFYVTYKEIITPETNSKKE